MNKHRFTVRRAGLRLRAVSQLLVLVAAGAALSVPALAAQVLARFDVMITVRTPEARPETGSCQSSTTDTAGSTPTLVCTSRPVNDILLTSPSGREIIAQSPVPLPTTAVAVPAVPAAPDPAKAPRPSAGSPADLRTPVAAGGYRFMSYMSGLTGTIDIYTAKEMMTAFRLVTWAEREYIEMTVTW